MNVTRAYAVFLRYTYIVRNNPQRLFQIFIWGVLDIIVWGFLTTYLDRIGQATFSFVPVLLGAVILWAFLIRVQQGVTTPALEDIWVRNLLNYFASPLKVSEYTFGLIMASVVIGAAGLVILFTLALLFFGFSLLQFDVLLIPFVGILFLFGVAIGIVGTAIVVRFGPSAEWFIWPIPSIISPFVGVLYPISVLPEWIQWFSHILAPTYVFEGMRAAILSGAFDGGGFAIGLALALLSIALAYAIFVRVFQRTLKSGAFARYSAENIL